MKQVYTFILALFTVSAHAGPNGYHGSALHRPHHHHHHYHHDRHNPWGWVGPAIISGAVVYAITRPPVVSAPPVISAPPVDIIYIDGVAYRKQWIQVNGAYQEVLVRM